MTYAVAGARGPVEDPERTLAVARHWAEEHGVEVLLVDARAVFGPEHLESAFRHAERAKKDGTMATRSLSMETLLYLSGHRQVTDAIRIAGIRRGTESIAVLITPAIAVDELLALSKFTRDDSVLLSHGKALAVLGITTEAERTVPEDRRSELALERTALLDVDR